MFDDYYFGKVAAHAYVQEWQKLAAKKDKYEGPRARDVAVVGGVGAAGAGAGALGGELAREGARMKRRRLEREVAGGKKTLSVAKAMAAKHKKEMAELPAGVMKHAPPAAVEQLKRTSKWLASKKKTLAQAQKAIPKKWKGPLVGTGIGLGVGGAAVGGHRIATSPEAKKKIKKTYKKYKKYV